MHACVCVHVCVCSWNVPAPVSTRGGGWGARPVPVPLCSRTSCVTPEHGSRAPPLPGHPLPPVWLPARPPWAQLGFAIAHISWGSFVDGGSSLALSLWLLNEVGGRGGTGQPAQGRMLSFKDRKPNLLTQHSLGDRRDLGVPPCSTWTCSLCGPLPSLGPAPLRGVWVSACCLPQQVTRPGPL